MNEGAGLSPVLSRLAPCVRSLEARVGDDAVVQSWDSSSLGDGILP